MLELFLHLPETEQVGAYGKGRCVSYTYLQGQVPIVAATAYELLKGEL